MRRFPNQRAVKVALDDAARLVEIGGEDSIPGIVRLTHNALASVVEKYPAGAAAFREAYYLGIGYTGSSVTPSPSPSPAPPVVDRGEGVCCTAGLIGKNHCSTQSQHTRRSCDRQMQ
jgi:hypothetical protein